LNICHTVSVCSASYKRWLQVWKRKLYFIWCVIGLFSLIAFAML
jgi:hypothetical protein